MFNFVFAQGCDFGKEESTTFIVATPPNVNAVLEELNVPLFVSAGEIEIDGEFSNKGIDTIKSIDINWVINNGTVNTQSLTDLNIPTHETYDFIHNVTWNASDLLSTNDLKVWISNLNGTLDEVPNNDTLSLNVFILDEVSEKRVLIEHFTNASCSPCANQNPALSALIETGLNEWEVSHIAYHTSWPGTDPMYTFNLDNDLKNARVSYYGVGGVPNAVLSGNKFQGSPADVKQDMIDVDWARPGLFNITADLTYANDSVYINAELTSLADFNDGEIIAHAVLIEDLVYSSAPGTNGEKEFPDVMRYMFPDVNGTNIGLPAYDQVINLSFKHKMDTEVSEEMELVVFIQNNSDKEIYGVYQLVSTTAPEVTFNVLNGEEDVPLDMNFLVNFDLSVRYLGGEAISSADTLVYLKVDSIDGEDVPFTTIIAETKKIITINLINDLEPKTTYFLGIENGLEGYNGTPVADRSVSFKTTHGVGVEKIESEYNTVFYPNPTKEELNISFYNHKNCEVKIRIFNESGQLVKISDKGKLSEGKHNIILDLSKLNNGLYFINILSGNESITQKIQIIK